MLHVDDGNLHAYLDGELRSLDAVEHARVEAHLAECDDCRARRDEAARVRDRARFILSGAGPAHVDVPPFEQVAAGVSIKRAWWSDYTRLRTVAWAASVVLALAVGWQARELWLRSVERETFIDESGAPVPRTGAEQEEQQPERLAIPPGIHVPPAEDAGAASTGTVAADRAARQSPPPRPTAGAAPRRQEIAAELSEEAAAKGAGAAGPQREDVVAEGAQVRAREEAARVAAAPAVIMEAAPPPAAAAPAQPPAVPAPAFVAAGERKAELAEEEAVALAKPAEKTAWAPVERREAERRLGAPLVTVEGLPVFSIELSATSREPVARVTQRLASGGLLELVQERAPTPTAVVETPAVKQAEGAAARRLAVEAHRTEAAGARELDASFTTGTARLLLRRDGSLITATAPLPLDSLRALLKAAQ